jgi:hypothetical protein
LGTCTTVVVIVIEQKKQKKNPAFIYLFLFCEF